MMGDNEREKTPQKSKDNPSSWGEGNDRLRTERDLEDDQK